MERLLRRKVKGDPLVNMSEVKKAKPGEDVSTPSPMPSSDAERVWKSNPFLAPPVLRSLMKNIGLPTELKMLRKVCQVWDEVAVEELKKRAFEGSIKLINLSWHWGKGYWVGIPESKPLPIPELEAKFSQFLEDTQRIPKLFQGFHFNPEFLLVANKDKFQSFLSSYTISFLKLRPAIDLKEEDIKLINSFLATVASNLRALEISWSHLTEIQKMEPPKIMSSEESRFPKLQHLFFGRSKGPASFLKDLFGAELLSAPNLTHLHFDEYDEKYFEPVVDPDNFSRWLKLTHLDIGGIEEREYKDVRVKLTAWILKLGKAGMSLKSFGMKLELSGLSSFDDEDEEWMNGLIEENETLSLYFVQISQNITRFLRTQANCLEELRLEVDINLHLTIELEDENSALIWLPVFTSLRRLDMFWPSNCGFNTYEFRINGKDSQEVVRFHSYSHNFPKLEELTIRGKFEDLEKWGDYEEPPLSLKRLKITDGRAKYKKRVPIEQERSHLANLVGLVNTFEVGMDDLCVYKESGEMFFHREGEEIPWIESLSSLHLYKPRTTTLKLGHLKNLKELVIKDIMVWDRTFKGPRILDLDIDYKAYLDKFKYVAKLDLDCIKFHGFVMTEEIREEIVKYFPFRVEIIESDVKWKHCRSHTCCY